MWSNMLCTTRSIVAQVTSWYALIFAAVCTLVVLGNNLGQDISGVSFYALTYFFMGLALGWNARSLGLTVVIFLLPLTPTFSKQLAAIVPLFEVKRTLSGYDLVAGFVAGHVLRYLIYLKSERSSFALPPPISFACLVLTVSVFLAIARNLWQAASVFSFAGLKYNAMNMLSIGWRDDFYPLVDFFTYGLAAAFVACALQVLSEKERSAETILKPLLWGVIVSALWSVLQSKTGLGLPYSSASGNRYYQGFGFAGTGFQPDIHAFSGHMLIGAVGAFGCFFLRDAKISRWLITAAILMGWVGLAVSKSRGSALLACTFYALIGAWWLWQRNKTYLFMVTTAIFFGMGAVYLFHRWGMSIIPLWLIQYVEGLPRLHINNLETLNAHFGYRAEIYRAVFRMFEQFPLMGVGQGAFYRMSGMLEFSGSKFLASINGENAHNYFLQILAEMGLIGFFTLAAVIVIPIVRARFSSRLLPIGIMLIAFGLGNIFAHSLLIRENFFLFAACVALLYVQAQRSIDAVATENAERYCESVRCWHLNPKNLKRLALAFCLMMAALIIREVYASFGRFPYVYGVRCYAPTTLKTGDWTSGTFILDVPSYAKGVELKIRETQPAFDRVPLFLLVSVQQASTTIAQKTLRYDLGVNAPQNIVIPIDSFDVKAPKTLVFTTSRCFTPKNLGVNADPRRLGIVVEKVLWRTN
jgi:O-antigen ligase